MKVELRKMAESRNWNASLAWKYPLHKRIIDVFDPSNRSRLFTAKFKRSMQSAASIAHDVFTPAPTPTVVNHEKYIDVPVEVMVPRKKKVIVYKDVEVQKVKTRYNVKLSENVKTITVPNIKIKWKMPLLKKIAVTVFIVFFPLLVIAAIILGSRMVWMTNSDLTSELARYRVEERMQEKMAPYMFKIDDIKSRLDVMEANQLPIYIYQVKTKYRVIDKTTRQIKFIEQ
jgi:hypothetical protein